MTVEDDIGDYVCMMLESEGYSSATIIAPGAKYKKVVDRISRIVKVNAVYDKDPNLDYTTADPIFDDVEIDSDIIITLHGEKLYPPCWKWVDIDHIMVVNNGFHLDPTSDDKFDEEDFTEVTHLGQRTIYYKVANGFY
jgi:hypothetical protein